MSSSDGSDTCGNILAGVCSIYRPTLFDIFIGLNYRADTVTSFIHVQCTCRLIVNATTQCAYKSPLCSTCMWAFLCSDYKGDGMMKVEKNKKVQE